jgi:AcrR family transcriptional regulator
MDRRVARTREALLGALIELIAKREYDAITVEDICAKAGVGRSTFYAHYTGKDDLKRSGMTTLRRELSASVDGAKATGESLAFSLPLLRHARAHVGHYRAMLGSRGGAISLAVVRKLVTEYVRREVDAVSVAGPVRTATIAFIAGGYLAVLTQWLDGGAVEDPAEIDATIRRLIARGLAPQTKTPPRRAAFS